MGSFIARQPIFNRNLDIYGYEILHRDSAASTEFGATDENVASSETITNTFHSGEIEKITCGKRAFVNFSEKLLLDGVATILPNKVLVIELLENILPSEAVLEACTHLRKKGYLIALDDFILEPEFMPLIAVADIIKIDFLSTPMSKIEKFSALMKDKGIRMLAEKLETHESFEAAKDMGFSLFQGYFFSKPVIVAAEQNRLNPLKVNCLRLIRLSMEDNVNYTKIATIIKQDVALSYRLLRVVNSAFFGLRYSVKNIRQALAILGMDDVKKWITLISLAEIKDAKPDELIRISLFRAKFLELFSQTSDLKKDSDDLFMLGLMSQMDALMDLSKEEIVKQTNLSPKIAIPLLSGTGVFGELLSIVIHYEKSEWDEALALAEKYNISSEKLTDFYSESIEWASQF